jgi:hypothetical protein
MIKNAIAMTRKGAKILVDITKLANPAESPLII